MYRLQVYRTTQLQGLSEASTAMDRMSLTTYSNWMPPRSTQCKANFDGAVFQDSQMACVGVVIRNSCGSTFKEFVSPVNSGRRRGSSMQESNQLCSEPWP
nr:hypothetical protein CFP56_27767 [Quercus suber]